MADLPDMHSRTEAGRLHLANVTDNLQLIADLGYADTALAVAAPDGSLTVAADARPSTAMPPFTVSRVGMVLDRAPDAAAYQAVAHVRRVDDDHVRRARGGVYTTIAYPIGALSERLETRKALDRAKGLLMAGGMSEADAFRTLQKLAMDKRLTLRAVAEQVIAAGDLVE
jgi:hypothetical protein